MGDFVSCRPLNRNMYGYVRNSPLTLIDPSGLEATAEDCIEDPESCEAGGGDGGGIPWPGGGGGSGGTPPPNGPVPYPGVQQGPGGAGVGNCAFVGCQAQPVGSNLPNSGINIGTLVNFLNCNALPGFGKGQCSPYVYLVFQKAGAVFKSPIPKGRNFGPLLEQIGCPALNRTAASQLRSASGRCYCLSGGARPPAGTRSSL